MNFASHLPSPYADLYPLQLAPHSKIICVEVLRTLFNSVLNFARNLQQAWPLANAMEGYTIIHTLAMYYMAIDLSRVVRIDFLSITNYPPKKSIPQIRMVVLEKLLHSTVKEDLLPSLT